MDTDGKVSYETIAEVAKAHGWKVGIVSSVSIDHATPAVFYAHQPSRSNYREIGEALATSDFDYFAGGPLKRVTKSSDGKEEGLPDLYEMAEENGFTVLSLRSFSIRQSPTISSTPRSPNGEKLATPSLRTLGPSSRRTSA